MMKFVKLRYYDRYTRNEGNDLWLNLDKVIGIDENSNTVHCVGDYFYHIDEKSLPTLIEALKGSAE